MSEPGYSPEDVAAVHVDYLGRVIIARVFGEVDLLTAGMVGKSLFACLDGTPRALVVDLTQVDFLGATGTTLLMAIHQQALRDDVRLRFATGTSVVLRTLEVSGLSGHLPLSRSVRDALDSITTAWNAGMSS